VDVPNPPRPVFVTAAHPEDAAIASGLLRRCGLESSSVFDAQVPSDPAAGSFEQIARADGAVATTRGAELPAGVIYELGFAQGLGLPTLVLFLIGAEDDLPLLPGDLRGLQQVRWDPATEPDTALLARVRGLLTARIIQAVGLQVVRHRFPTPTRHYTDSTEERAAEVLGLVGAEVAAEGPGTAAVLR
jgi:hypothetical protein